MPAQPPPTQPASIFAEASALVSAIAKRLVGDVDESAWRSELEKAGLTLISFDKDAGTALVVVALTTIDVTIGFSPKTDTTAAGR